MEFNWASSKKTQGARYLSRAIFFALKKKVDNRGCVQYQYKSSFTC